MPDEVKPRNVFGAVSAVVVRFANGLREKTDAFVVADRFRRRARSFGKFADSHAVVALSEAASGPGPKCGPVNP